MQNVIMLYIFASGKFIQILFVRYAKMLKGYGILNRRSWVSFQNTPGVAITWHIMAYFFSATVEHVEVI